MGWKPSGMVQKAPAKESKPAGPLVPSRRCCVTQGALMGTLASTGGEEMGGDLAAGSANTS